MSDTQIYEPDTSGTRTFGKYQVIKELGRGAMGVVYQCFDPDFERTVAIKILSPELLSLDSTGEYRQRFKNEMKAAGRLSHPNVINVYDAGEQEGVPYFVMEYVDGIELKQALDDGERFELQKTLRLMRDILNGLGYIHKNGITHRDLKPANIFITRDGSAKITDFGIAKLESSELTRVGTIIGSPRFMSPEQCQGLHVDTRSDLFSAGIIFYQLLTNEHCFDANSPTAIMQKIIHSSPEAPSVLIPTLAKPYDDVVFKALEKTQEKRFQTAEEFIEALEAAVAGKKITPSSPVPKILGAAAGILMGAFAAIYFLPQFISDKPASEVQGTASAKATSGADGDPVQTEKLPGGEGGDSLSGDLKSVDSTGNSTDKVTNVDQSEQGKVAPEKIASQTLTVPDAAGQADNLSPGLAAKVDKLLKVAKVHQLQGRLVTPSGSSAYDAYRIVLDIDPGNARAIAGLESLEQTLVKKIRELNENGNEDLAHSQALAGAKLFPQNNDLTRLAESK